MTQPPTTQPTTRREISISSTGPAHYHHYQRFHDQHGGIENKSGGEFKDRERERNKEINQRQLELQRNSTRPKELNSFPTRSRCLLSVSSFKRQ